MTRIIAGVHRGRRLVTPRGDKTRPTSDRAREALFSTLAARFDRGGDADEAMADVPFLDLYAGSGAIGLEAASRGASPVVCVERDRAAAAVVSANIAALGERVAVVAQSVETYLAGPCTHPFGVVWLDPPYACPDSEVAAVLERLVTGAYLAPGGVIVAERSSRGGTPAVPSGFVVDSVRRYGEAALYFICAEDA